jgi:hypothetical protein
MILVAIVSIPLLAACSSSSSGPSKADQAWFSGPPASDTKQLAAARNEVMQALKTNTTSPAVCNRLLTAINSSRESLPSPNDQVNRLTNAALNELEQGYKGCSDAAASLTDTPSQTVDINYGSFVSDGGTKFIFGLGAAKIDIDPFTGMQSAK